MKTKFVLLSALLSAGLVAGAFAAQGRGNGGSGRNASCPAAGSCDLSGPGQGTPRRDGSGKSANGTPRLDGSGRATAPGNGAKAGTGNRSNCPNPPTR